MISFYFSALTPCLFLIFGIQKLTKRSGLGSFLIIALFSVALLALRVQGLSIAAWIASFSESWSLLLTGLLCIAVLENFFAIKFFTASDWKATWIFGAAASLLLYPSALGLGRFDTYSLGWHSHSFIAGVALLAVICLWKKIRLGMLLLGALIAYALHLQGSANLWNYLIDPFYGFLSLMMVLGIAVRSIRRSW